MIDCPRYDTDLVIDADEAASKSVLLCTFSLDEILPELEAMIESRGPFEIDLSKLKTVKFSGYFDRD